MIKVVLEKLQDKHKSSFAQKNLIILPGIVSTLEKLGAMEQFEDFVQTEHIQGIVVEGLGLLTTSANDLMFFEYF